MQNRPSFQGSDDFITSFAPYRLAEARRELPNFEKPIGYRPISGASKVDFIANPSQNYLGRSSPMVAMFSLVSFSLGILVGYTWRERISRARRAKYSAERRLRKHRQTIGEFDEGVALAPRDDLF
jgi:hypothetical protein